MLDNFLHKPKNIQDESGLNSKRENDQYMLDHAKKWLQIIFTWCITICIKILAFGFIIVFGKYIISLTFMNDIDLKTEKILGNILDWTFKIVFGWLAKSFFEKNKS